MARKKGEGRLLVAGETKDGTENFSTVCCITVHSKMPSNKGMGDAAAFTTKAKNRIGLMAVLSSLSYSFCSVSMVMSNKVNNS